MSGSFDLRRLRYFIKVAELGSVTRAAEALHVAQPALSQQMRLLESELGVQLLARGPRGVSLTEAGQRMLREARNLSDGMRGVVERVKGEIEPEGQVVIGVGQSIGAVLMVPLLERVAARLPLVRVQVRELLGGLLPELMRSGAIDFALSLNTVTGDNTRSQAILAEDMCLVGQRRLAEPFLAHSDAAHFRFRDLDGLPLYLSRRGQFVRDTVERFARSKGITLNLRGEVDSLHILREIALSGTGCCILPRTSVRREIEDRDLYVGRITSPVIRRDIYLVHRRDMPRAAAEVVVQALEVVEAMVKDGTWPATLKLRSRDIRKTL
jgi:LysR family nitrogen assimilation transcriptional regulator